MSGARPYRRYSGGPTRTCSRCEEPKPIDQFGRDVKDRVRSHCIPCARAVTQEWRARNHQELLERRRATYPGIRARYAALRAGGLTSVEANAPKR